MGFQTTISEFPVIGYSGTMAAGVDANALTMKNVEASTSIPFGFAVAFKTSSPTTDLDALLPAAQADKIAGLVKFSHAYARSFTDTAGTVIGDLDGTGLRPNALLSVVRSGRMLVKCESGCKPGDYLFVRAAGTGVGGGTKGCLENAADASNMVDCSKQGTWVSTAVAGALAYLEFDFVNKP